MFRIILLLTTILFASVSLSHEGFASVSYDPADKLFLTGTTTDTRFDVASPLSGTNFSGAYLDTTSLNMSGAFYMNGIGWALMSSGSFQVRLNCGAQSLSSLTTQCQFSGSGWSENIGEVGFASVRYNPSTATLSGSITSFAGNFTVEGVILPLRMVGFNESLASLTANHALSLSIREPGKYPFALGGSWGMEVSPASNLSEMRLYGGGMNGNFTTDVSLADSYTIEVTDPQGSITTYDSVVVNPGTMSQTHTLGHFADVFCSSNSTLITVCPDGATRQATTHQKTSSTTPIANGVDTHNFTLKLRDTYGNRVTTGNVEVSYTGTVSNIQIPGDTQSVTYSTQANWKDALVFAGDIVPIWDMSGNWSNSITNPVTDISYTIASKAPTDSPDNIVVLDRITYTPPVAGPIQTLIDTTRLDFDEPYTATLNPPTNLRVAATNVFEGNFVSLAGSPPNPELITLFKVGSGNLARMTNLRQDGAFSTESPSTDWMVDYSTTSHIIASLNTSPFSITGVYMPTTAYPELETVYYEGLVHYVIGGNDVIYPVFSDSKVSEYLASKVKILGQNNARSEYGTIGTNSNTRMGFISALRKNISLMNRGRTSYTDVDYRVYTGAISINNGDFTNHRTIIVLGADVTITANIDKHSDSLAIIVLADENDVGGNIIVEDGVTDIHAGLFAERAVLTTGVKAKQLYIYGALVSGNTLGETTAGICPYYIASCTYPENYDLEYLRTYDGTIAADAATSPRASEHPGAALIIEYDMRLQSDPPPAIPD